MNPQQETVISAELQYHDKPCAAKGFDSYRCRGTFGWIMIGANSVSEAHSEVLRSAPNAKLDTMQKWNGSLYIA